jgi:hypothetical protein
MTPAIVMRRAPLLVFVAVLASAFAAAQARPASASDADVRARFVAGFLIVLRADDDVRACHGCDAALAVVQRKALLWINAMSSSAPSTNRGIRARLSGGLAFWHWSRAAYQWNLGSSDDEYSSEATEAIRYAWAALKASASTRLVHRHNVRPRMRGMVGGAGEPRDR